MLPSAEQRTEEASPPRLLFPPPPTNCNVTAQDFMVHRASTDLEAKSSFIYVPVIASDNGLTLCKDQL